MKKTGRPHLLPVVLLCAVVALRAHSATAQAQASGPFAVGAGGSVINDTGSAEDLKSFGTWGGYVFAELEVEQNLLLQLRYSRFDLPAAVSGSPNLRVDAGDVLVSYVFREAWWRGGFTAGGGYYGMQPKSPEPGQIVNEPDETKYGWAVGLVSIFDIAPHWDLRLEGIAHFIRSQYTHQPIVLSAGVTYRF